MRKPVSAYVAPHNKSETNLEKSATKLHETQARRTDPQRSADDFAGSLG